MLTILAEAAQQTPVEVKPTVASILTAVGMWTAIIGTVGGIFTRWLLTRPKMAELANNKQAVDMAHLNARIIALEAKVDEANHRAGTASDKAHNAEMKMVSSVSALQAALQLVMSELRKHDPDSPALQQAQELIAIAVTGDFGMDRAVNKLSTIKGVGEA